MKSKVQSPRSKVTQARPRLWTLDFGLWTLFTAASLLAADVDISKLPPPASRQIDFAADIKPIFEASCLRCHGTERPKSRFSLATREAALKGGDTGIAIIPGDSAKSPLIHYVARLVPDMEMPPEDKGDPLTREQIAVLRAWIDQGVLWEKVDLSAQYALQFSAAPAVRWVTLSGNAQKFQEHQWLRRGFSGGVSDFRIAQKLTNGFSVVAEGRALTDDYRITLDIRKDDTGFARFGFEEFRRYYDDHGPYYPFRASGFATQTRNIFSLDRDLHLDVGKAFAEFGLTRPEWPQAIVGYEYHFRDGSKSTEEWGPVSQRNSETRHIYPAYKMINEDVHVLRLDVSHDIAGTRVEDNLRAEFFDLKTKRVAARDFPSGQVYPTAFTITRDTHDQLLLANTLRGEKSLRDWLFVSGGYRFAEFDADATVNLDNRDGAGRPAGGQYWYAQGITLSEHSHLFNFNALGGPWDGFTAALGLQNEWSEQHGLGRPNYRVGDPGSPIGLPRGSNGWAVSVTDRLLFEESLSLRYTKIPATVLFAEAKLKQERRAIFEEQIGEHDFLRDTDAATDRQEYKAGFEVSPWRRASFKASYKHRIEQNDYDDNIEPDDGYPAFIRARETESDMFEARLALRPLPWLRATLSYQLALTDYDSWTDSMFTPATGTNPPVLQTPRGHIFAGEYDSSTYSANITLTPWRRWYLSTTFSYEQSRTWSANYARAIVVPFEGDTYSVVANSTFVLTTNIDLFGSYSFSRARFAQNNVASAVPLGIDYDLHGVQFGFTRRFSRNVTATLQYGFFDYTEPTARGFSDYTAHMVFATIAVRLP